jgi:hypothetical protein
MAEKIQILIKVGETGMDLHRIIQHSSFFK